jgi:hypothetical protein
MLTHIEGDIEEFLLERGYWHDNEDFYREEEDRQRSIKEAYEFAKKEDERKACPRCKYWKDHGLGGKCPEHDEQNADEKEFA